MFGAGLVCLCVVYFLTSVRDQSRGLVRNVGFLLVGFLLVDDMACVVGVVFSFMFSFGVVLLGCSVVSKLSAYVRAFAFSPGIRWDRCVGWCWLIVVGFIMGAICGGRACPDHPGNGFCRSLNSTALRPAIERTKVDSHWSLHGLHLSCYRCAV